MLEHLRPYTDDHAISKVVATIFFPQEFIKPKDIFDKIKETTEFNHFQRKFPILSTTININNQNYVGNKEEKYDGFIFENFNEIGELDKIFRLDNSQNNQVTVSIEFRKYSRWANLKDELDNFLNAFFTHIDPYSKAISLRYRDEFTWTDKDSLINVSSIFNIDSELLNNRFIQSRNGTLALITQGQNTDDQKFEEKLEISFNNDQKKIIIDHIYAIQFDDYELFSNLTSNTNISNYFDFPHKANKEVLKNILEEKVQKMIKLI